MAALNIMPLMTDAIMADCGYMPNAVFGAYMKMLIQWWRVGARPMSGARLRLIAGCSEEEFDLIAEHLTATPEGFVQKKLQELWQRQTERSDKAKAKAQQRWGNATADAAADAAACPAAMQSMNHEPDKLSDDNLSTAQAPKKKQSATRATRLPSDWRPPPDWIGDAIGLGLSENEAKNEADRFRDYWIAKSGKDGAKLDWRATWRNWCRNFAERRGKASSPNGGARSGGPRFADPVEVRNRLQRELAEAADVPGDGRLLRSAGVG